jgi:putative intracellular protease/amidase
MKKLVRFALLMLLLSTWAGCVSQLRPISASPKVLIVIRGGYASVAMPYMTDNELGVMIDLLEDAGFELSVASLTYDPFESETRTITPDLLVGAVDAAEFDAVVLPCLAAGTTPDSPEIVELLTEFDKQEKVIAVQHGARYDLHTGDIIDLDQLTSREVLQKGRVITSFCCPYQAKHYGCEDATRALIEKLITTLNKGV